SPSTTTNRHPQIQTQTTTATINSQFFPIHDEDNEYRPYMSVKRKLSGLS
ncbi:unnamed protein product, partial [Adineta steineri]